MKELLIVDDDVAIRTALEVGFRRGGWITETASCVQEALFKFRNHVFPLVITDVKMPVAGWNPEYGAVDGRDLAYCAW
jgi:DNA-binding NtrC family response regulator